MKTKLNIWLVCMIFAPVLSFSQNSYVKTWDIDFSGGNNGNFGGLDASDVAVTFNAVDSKMQVEVNKVVYTWSYLNIFMGNCWTKRIVYDQANRYIEFRIKSSVALTDIGVSVGGGTVECPKAAGKTWPGMKFSVTEDEVGEWKIILLTQPPTTGGTQNVLDTIDQRLIWNLPNGSYTFDYVKIGEAAIPPKPTMDQVKDKIVSEKAGQQAVTISNINIPNRTLDGLTIEATTEKDGIIKDVAFVDLDGAGSYIDVDAKTATLNYTPVDGMKGQSDKITVTLKDNIRNTETSMTFSVNLIGGSLSDIANEINIYPTTVSSIVNIDLPKAINGKISIIDMLGNTQMLEELKDQSNASINLSSLASGIYIIKISDADGSITKTIVKE